MKCENVLKHLSWFVDDLTDRDEADRMSRHLNQCSACHREFNRLLELRRKLGALDHIVPPDYLKHLIDLQLDTAARQPWLERLRTAWEYRWSKIRTTEGMWYLTRLMGTATTFVFFLVISAAVSPIYLSFDQQQMSERTAMYQTFREKLLKNLGIPVEVRRSMPTPQNPRSTPSTT
jgi:anti-sigma factor RsiW